MSNLLERLDELGARFAPHAYDATLDIGPMLAACSVSSHFFFAYANENKGAAFHVHRLYDPPWREDPDVLTQFGKLDLEDQVEVLTVYTVPIHEIRHHIDFSVTTFGAEFYGLLAAEYLSFQDVSPYLLQNQEAIPRRPLRRLDSHLADLGAAIPEEWREHWSIFEHRLRNFEAGYDYRGVDPMLSNAKPTDDGVPMNVLDRSFNLVTVNDRALSLSPSDRPGWYMRSSTLLEARAVAGALLWILDTLDGHASLAPALSSYVAQHYPPDAPYDYRFVLDMAARWLGANRIEEVVEAERWQGLRTALHLLDAAAWFALNGGLKQTDAGLARINPFLRFGYAVQELDVAYRSGADRPALELLSDFDEQERGRSLGFVPIGVALATAIHELEQVQERIVPKIWQRAVAEHFRHVLGLLARSLHHRVETGYVSPFAAPPDGNVIPWLGGKHQFLDALYEPHRWVTDWFSFRNRAIFTPGGIWTRDRLREQFGLAEMVIPCDCGFLISAAVPRWRETHQVQCQCGRVHNLGADDLTYIAVPEDMEA